MVLVYDRWRDGKAMLFKTKAQEFFIWFLNKIQSEMIRFSTITNSGCQATVKCQYRNKPQITYSDGYINRY